MSRPWFRHRRRAPCTADIVLGVALIAAVPLSQRAVAAGPGAGTRVELHRGAATTFADLRHDGDYTLDGPLGATMVRVQGGAVWIAAATCRDRLCMRMGRLQRPGRALVCLPNRIVVRVRGTTADVDAIAR